uniref:LRRCT domain-containing protein n=1 Tax=Bracon brevicornis TaxID=1563983 RepID=A0A6V7IMC9_9HYME
MMLTVVDCRYREVYRRDRYFTMKVIILNLLLVLLVQADDEVCQDANGAFRYCVKDKILTRVTKDGPALSWFQNLRHVWLKFNDDIEIAPNAFSQVDLTSLWLTFPDVNDDRSSSKVLTLHPDSLAHLPNLKQLRINNVNVKYEGNPFVHIPLVEELEWNYGNLTDIPKQLISSFPNLEKLDLEENRIERLPANIFEGNGLLKNIKLRSNRIRKLESGWSTGLDLLVRLDLADNSIAPENGIFNGISRISELEISEAFGISGFQQHLIQNLSDLTYLGIGFNSIRSLEPGMFNGNPNLREISLYGNQIRHIPTGVFENFRSLEEIQLADNIIETIAPGAFSGLNMSYLGLTINRVKTIESRTFSGLQVRRFGFRKNQISDLKPYAFDGLTAGMFDVTYNKIPMIGADDFAGLTTEDLDLSGNPIKTIADKAFRNTKLKRLGLYNTPVGTVDKFKLGLQESVEIMK